MSEIILEAKSRTEIGRKTDGLRANGIVPAVVYGAGKEPQNISVERHAFVKAYEEAGESSLVELKVDASQALHVLIQDLQQDPIMDEVTHVDFRVVDMTKPIETFVVFELTGESSAVKGLGGTLVQSLEGVNIRCLPNKLLRHMTVDISKLMTFEDKICISDLAVPEGVEILDEPTVTIAIVAPPRSEAEMAALNEAVEENVEAVAVATEKKEPEETETQASE